MLYYFNWKYVTLPMNMLQYNLTEELAIGAYQFSNSDDTKPPITLCKLYYKVANIWAFNETYVYVSDKEEGTVMPAIITLFRVLL